MDGKKFSLDFKTIKRDVLRHWPIWVSASVVYLLSVCFTHVVERSSVRSVSVREAIGYDVGVSLVLTTDFLAFIMGLVASIAAFGFLTSKKKDYFFETLPFNKLSLFLNRFIFGFILCMIPCFFITVVEVLQVLIQGRGAHLYIVFEWLFTAVCIYLFWYAFAVIFLVMCGRIVMAGFCYFGFSFAGLVISLILEITNMLYFVGVNSGTGLGYSVFGILSPLDYTFSIGLDSVGNLSDYDFPEWHMVSSDTIGKLMIILCVGIALVCVSLLLFKKRRSEKTGDTFVFSWMKTVFCYALTFVTSVVLALILVVMIIYTDDGMAHRLSDRIGTLIILCIVGFILFIGSIMIVEKKFKVFTSKHMLKALIFTIVLGLVGFGYMHDLFNIEGYVPKAGNVNKVVVNNNDLLFPDKKKHLEITDNEVKEKIIELHELILDNMDDLLEGYNGGLSSNNGNSSSNGFISTSLVDLRDTKKHDYYTVYLSYDFKNGDKVSRSYLVYVDSAIDNKIQAFLDKNRDLFNSKLEDKNKTEEISLDY